MPNLSLLEGAGLIVAGMVLGRFWPARSKGRKPDRPPQPVCGCGHHHGFHHPGTGECHGTARGEVTGRDSWGSPDDWAQVPCGCKTYSGPEPLPEYFAPEITP